MRSVVISKDVIYTKLNSVYRLTPSLRGEGAGGEVDTTSAFCFCINTSLHDDKLLKLF